MLPTRCSNVPGQHMSRLQTPPTTLRRSSGVRGALLKTLLLAFAFCAVGLLHEFKANITDFAYTGSSNAESVSQYGMMYIHETDQRMYPMDADAPGRLNPNEGDAIPTTDSHTIANPDPKLIYDQAGLSNGNIANDAELDAGDGAWETVHIVGDL